MRGPSTLRLKAIQAKSGVSLSLQLRLAGHTDTLELDSGTSLAKAVTGPSVSAMPTRGSPRSIASI